MSEGLVDFSEVFIPNRLHLIYDNYGSQSLDCLTDQKLITSLFLWSKLTWMTRHTSL